MKAKNNALDKLKEVTVTHLMEILAPINDPPEGRLEGFKKSLEPHREALESGGHDFDSVVQDLFEASKRFDERIKAITGREPHETIAACQAAVVSPKLDALIEHLAGKVVDEEMKNFQAAGKVRIVRQNEWDDPPEIPQGWTAIRMDKMFTTDQMTEVQKIMRQSDKDWTDRGKELRLYLRTLTLPEGLKPDFLGYALENLWREGKMK